MAASLINYPTGLNSTRPRQRMGGMKPKNRYPTPPMMMGGQQPQAQPQSPAGPRPKAPDISSFKSQEDYIDYWVNMAGPLGPDGTYNAPGRMNHGWTPEMVIAHATRMAQQSGLKPSTSAAPESAPPPTAPVPRPPMASAANQTRPPSMIQGKPAQQFFQDEANSTWQPNRFAKPQTQVVAPVSNLIKRPIPTAAKQTPTPTSPPPAGFEERIHSAKLPRTTPFEKGDYPMKAPARTTYADPSQFTAGPAKPKPAVRFDPVPAQRPKPLPGFF